MNQQDKAGSLLPNYSYKSTFESECFDCNCNNCIFMKRDMEKFVESCKNHDRNQFNYFTTIKNKLIDKANFVKKRFYDLELWDFLMSEAEKMRYQFDKKQIAINYGYCEKLNKDVSFIPNTCQLDTQECFQHRRIDINTITNG